MLLLSLFAVLLLQVKAGTVCESVSADNMPQIPQSYQMSLTMQDPRAPGTINLHFDVDLLNGRSHVKYIGGSPVLNVDQWVLPSVYDAHSIQLFQLVCVDRRCSCQSEFRQANAEQTTNIWQGCGQETYCGLTTSSNGSKCSLYRAECGAETVRYCINSLKSPLEINTTIRSQGAAPGGGPSTTGDIVVQMLVGDFVGNPDITALDDVFDHIPQQCYRNSRPGTGPQPQPRNANMRLKPTTATSTTTSTTFTDTAIIDARQERALDLIEHVSNVMSSLRQVV